MTSDTETQPAKRRTKTSMVLEAVRNQPGRTAREIDDLLGFKATAHKILRRLERRGLVEESRSSYDKNQRWWVT